METIAFRQETWYTENDTLQRPEAVRRGHAKRLTGIETDPAKEKHAI